VPSFRVGEEVNQSCAYALAQATVQYADAEGLDENELKPDDLTVRLRANGMTIFCTPVSITLDIPATTGEPEPAMNEAGVRGTLPGFGS
jgi:hypothetical protein